MKEERHYGLDLLRIMSMLGVVGIHFLNQGGWMASADSTSKLLIGRVLTSLCFCSVDVFAMLTGYLYVRRETVRTAKVLDLLLTTLFYCVTIPVAIAFLKPGLFRSFSDVYQLAIYPPLMGWYWYVTCYVLLFMMIPYINALIRSLQKLQLSRMLLILFLALSVLTTFGLNDYFKLDDGYSPFWLIFCYMVGAYIKLYKDDLPNHRIWKWIAALTVTIHLVVGLWWILGNEAIRAQTQILYFPSPFMVLQAALLLLIFSKIHFRSVPVRKAITVAGSGAFSVYVIHTHMLVFDYVLVKVFSWTRQPGTLASTAALIAGIMGIYLVCWCIDAIRQLLFKWLRADRFAAWLGRKIDAFLHFN